MKDKFNIYRKIFAFQLILSFFGILLIYLVKLHLAAGGWDWRLCFLPATQAFLSGRDPYQILGFFNPPWVFVATIPFALLPPSISGLAAGFMNFVAAALLAYRKRVNPFFAILLVFSPPVIWGFLLSNIDWLILIGLMLPPEIGLFFVMIKPQVGLGIAIFWLFESWQQGKFLRVIKVFSPVTAAYILSFLVYKFYLQGATQIIARDWNTSLFPYSILPGVLILAYALKKQAAGTASASAPFFSPYVGLSSWSITVFGLIQYPWAFLISNGILWTYFIFNKIFM